VIFNKVHGQFTPLLLNYFHYFLYDEPLLTNCSVLEDNTDPIDAKILCLHPMEHVKEIMNKCVWRYVLLAFGPTQPSIPMCTAGVGVIPRV